MVTRIKSFDAPPGLCHPMRGKFLPGMLVSNSLKVCDVFQRPVTDLRQGEE